MLIRGILCSSHNASYRGVAKKIGSQNWYCKAAGENVVQLSVLFPNSITGVTSVAVTSHIDVVPSETVVEEDGRSLMTGAGLLTADHDQVGHGDCKTRKVDAPHVQNLTAQFITVV